MRDSILSVDWSNFVGPEEYDPKKVAPVLLRLAAVETSSEVDKVVRDVLFSLGNNHRGTYFPAVLEAIPILIRFAEGTENLVAKIATKMVLNELFYFEPDTTNYPDIDEDGLRAFVTAKLAPYSDEHRDWHTLKSDLKLVQP